MGDLPEGDAESFVHGVSADGSTVVGESSTDSGRVAFRWHATSGLHALGLLVPGYGDSSALAVSADGGVIVGQASSPDYPFGAAFRWTAAGGMSGLGVIEDAQGTAAYAVSADGSVVAGGASLPQATQAFQWTSAGGFTFIHPFGGQNAQSNALALSADGGVAGGLGRSPAIYPNTQGFLWTAGTGAELGGLNSSSVFSAVHGLSADAGVAVGWSSSSSGTQAFRWTLEGGMTGLGDLPDGAFSSTAYACSGDGGIVVGAGTGGGGREAFIWTSATGMVSLAEFLAGHGVTLDGWALTEAVGISADGSVIVGNGTNSNGEPEGWVVTVRVTPPPTDDGEEDDGDGGAGGGDDGEEPPPPPPPPTGPECRSWHWRWLSCFKAHDKPWCPPANEDVRRWVRAKVRTFVGPKWAVQLVRRMVPPRPRR